jgi:hypothetical protein
VSWFRRTREPDPDAIAAVEQARQDAVAIEQQRAEVGPVVDETRRSMARNGYGEAILAALRGRTT